MLGWLRQWLGALRQPRPQDLWHEFLHRAFRTRTSCRLSHPAVDAQEMKRANGPLNLELWPDSRRCAQPGAPESHELVHGLTGGTTRQQQVQPRDTDQKPMPEALDVGSFFQVPPVAEAEKKKL